ncbi:MAG: hypothetical protein K2N36_07055, partial [Ruminiclostridium sp.]|nr:hypothetical protein [Ruminiclostridium sp.]
CLAVFSLKLTILEQKSGTSSIFKQAPILSKNVTQSTDKKNNMPAKGCVKAICGHKSYKRSVIL